MTGKEEFSELFLHQSHFATGTHADFIGNVVAYFDIPPELGIDNLIKRFCNN